MEMHSVTLVTVTPYDPHWPAQFAALGGTLRAALGGAALRIDHIGSTSVPGLAAKPVIDIQLSVAALEPMDVYHGALERLGYAWRAENDDRNRRYFREPAGQRRRRRSAMRYSNTSWRNSIALTGWPTPMRKARSSGNYCGKRTSGAGPRAGRRGRRMREGEAAYTVSPS